MPPAESFPGRPATADVTCQGRKLDSDDLEKQHVSSALEKLDIEHATVQDDPRDWSHHRKNIILIIVSAASMIAGLSANIQNPANQNIEDDLHASPSSISWSLSLFILFQGVVPLLWSAVSEIKGRKAVYLLSFAIFVLGSVIVAISKSIGLLIGMRVLQAAGSSAVIAIGTGTLADLYEPAERGSKIGLYYAAPLLGLSLGPILGGSLTQGFNWRAVFWFLVIFAGLNFFSFLVFFNDTFRRERSSAYQAVMKRRSQEHGQITSQLTAVENQGDGWARSKTDNNPLAIETPPLKDIKLSLTDVNPFPPLLLILKRWNNLAILFPSGLLFAFSFSITYTCARTMSNKYKYDALQTGLVLLAFGIGCLSGSILGGRWSDYKLAQMKANDDGKSHPEMRLESTKVAMWFLPPSVVGYAWVCEKDVHVSAVCVMLFLAGFFSIWIYASTLAYIVDANVGRSSTATASNSAIRGISAFVAAEIAVPLQDAIGDGGLYTIWAGVMIVAELFILLVLYQGGKWRERGQAKEREAADK